MLDTLYRPTKFSEVVGQDFAVSVLKGLAGHKHKARARSIVLQGAYGSGKSTLSRIFGKAMNCERFDELGDVCNECKGCKEASLKNSRLYFEFDATRVGSVDHIRSLDTLFATSTEGIRVITFDEVHACSKQAQTALLKVLEEGVKNTVFVFCTTDAVLETIKSRSLCLEIGTIRIPLIKQRVLEVSKLINLDICDDDLTTLAIMSKGHLRDALKILELYQISGKEALRNPVSLIKTLVLKAIKGEDCIQTINSLELFATADLRSSLFFFLRNCFISDDKFELALRQKGYAMKIFQWFFSVPVQQAMKEEVGMGIVLRAFVEKFKPV